MVDDPVVLCLSSRNSIVFYKFLGPRKSRAAFFFYPSIEFGLLRQLTELHLEVRISRQLVPPHVAVHIGQQASVQFSFLFVHDTGRNEIMQSLPKSIYTYVFLRMQPRMLSSVFSLYAEIPISHVQLPNYFFSVYRQISNPEHHRNRESFWNHVD